MLSFFSIAARAALGVFASLAGLFTALAMAGGLLLLCVIAVRLLSK